MGTWKPERPKLRTLSGLVRSFQLSDDAEYAVEATGGFKDERLPEADPLPDPDRS